MWGVKVLVKQLVLRLYHGVREELTPLMEISGVKQVRGVEIAHVSQFQTRLICMFVS